MIPCHRRPRDVRPRAHRRSAPLGARRHRRDLAHVEGLEVVGEVGDAGCAVRLTREGRPQVCVCDQDPLGPHGALLLDLSDADGAPGVVILATRPADAGRIAAAHPGWRVVSKDQAPGLLAVAALGGRPPR